MAERQCGSCTMCCKLLAVKELEKPACQWCSHVIQGKGCSIYETRPTACREFECAWLQGALPEDWRPDKVKFVVAAASAGDALIIHEDPTSNVEPSKTHRGLRGAIDRWARLGKVTFVLRGSKRRVLGDPKAVAALLKKGGAPDELIDAVKRAPVGDNPVRDLFLDTVMESVK